MGDDEGVQEYISWVVAIINQIKALGYKLEEPEVVSKVLRSLAPKFGFVAMAMKESKEIAKLTLDDLYGTLQAHKVRVNHALGKTIEKALHVKSELTNTNNSRDGNAGSSWGNDRGRGRSFSHRRGRDRGGHGRGFDNKSHI